MKFYLTAIGSGNSLNYPHQKKYDGVLALVENTENFGFCYKGKNGPKQDQTFYSKYDGTEYTYKRWLQIDSWQSTYEVGKKIITEIDNIKKQYPTAKFHFEISAGYKRIGSILTLISYIRNSDIYKLTFLSHDNVAETLPIIDILSDLKDQPLADFCFAKAEIPQI